ncbi:MAG: hypothetical protein AAF958_15215 [Planctomycetota bacterium]
MSTQLSNDNGKQPANIYLVLLILAAIFLTIAVSAMFIELGRWSPDYWKTNSARPQVGMILSQFLR